MFVGTTRLLSTVGLFSLALGCGGNNMPPKEDPFKEVPECKPGALVVDPLKGDRQVVLSKLEIAKYTEGFDMNGDRMVDNKLSALGSLANPAIKEAFDFQKNIIVPMEFFGFTGADSECAKFAFYLGRWTEDKDGDGRDTDWQPNKADCDDTNPNVKPGAKEDLANRIDDDCDGLADNAMKGVPAADMNAKQDQDGDGQTIADGDCDDRKGNAVAKLRKRGGAEICGNGIDDNCDGVPDNDLACDPYSPTVNAAVHVQQVSFKENSRSPLIVFPNGTVKNGVLNAGPNLFRLSLPFDKDLAVDLTLTGARVKATLKDVGGKTTVDGAILAGVLSAVSLAQIHLDAGGVLKKEQSLLDGVFVGPAGPILGLDTDNDRHYLPDIDVDGDGLETFWQENPGGPGPDGGAPLAIIDTCKDGDGSIVKSNFDGKGTLCAMAKDAKGNYRFVDGLSVALKFSAVPVKLADIVVK